MTNFGTGTDHIDVSGLAKKGIVVANTPDRQSVAVADMTYALMFAAARQVYQGNILPIYLYKTCKYMYL